MGCTGQTREAAMNYHRRRTDRYPESPVLVVTTGGLVRGLLGLLGGTLLGMMSLLVEASTTVPL